MQSSPTEQKGASSGNGGPFPRYCPLPVFPRLPRAGWVLSRDGRAGVPSLQPSITRLQESIVQELCESRGGLPGLSVLTNLLVSVDVKIYWTVLRHWSQLVPNMSDDI